MKILLINPPIRTNLPPNIPPMGLMYITSILKRDHEIHVLDINAHRFDKTQVTMILSVSEMARADIFAIGGMITTFSYIKWLIGVIKRFHPDKKIIVGGGVSVVATELHKLGADIVVAGEGERAITEAIRTWLPYIKLPPIDPLVVPFPAWKHWPMETYLPNPVGAINKEKWTTGRGQGIKSMTISASRGCPYSCTYCAKDFVGYKYRVRTAANVYEEMRILFEHYGVEYVHFVDDEFCVSKEFVYDLCDMLIRSGLGSVVSWGCTGRVNLVNQSMYSMMKRAGCISVAYGIESGSQKMLDIMRKGVKVSQAVEALKMTKDIFGSNDFSIMIGMPGETNDTLGETLDFMGKIGEKPTAVFFATAYPGTQLWKEVRHKIPDEIAYIESLGEQGKQIALNCCDLPDETLSEWQKKLMMV